MKKISSALVVGLFALVLAMPAKSGYYDSAASAAWANDALSYSRAQTNWHNLLYGYYGWYDSASVYEAWGLADIAAAAAFDAWWVAPIGSVAEYLSLEAYYQISAAEENLWYAYLYGNDLGSREYFAGAIWLSAYGQQLLGYAELAAAGQY